ncbi:sulfurtransferase TusA family protein [Candidatus Pyrohabitans sp.]
MAEQKQPEIRFVEGIVADAVEDVVYRMCPMHLMRLEERMKELRKGEILELQTDYEGALADIPDWCRKTGNELIGVEDTGEFFKFYVKKTRD